MMAEIGLLSIIIPYYNKRQLLLNTLRSIEYYSNDYPIETIVVDDCSRADQRICDIKELFPRLNINLIVITHKDVIWRGPVIAYNIGFNIARGDVVLINGTDCLHMGNLLGYIFTNFTPDSYLSFSAYRGSKLPDGLFDNLNWNKSTSIKALKSYFDVRVPDNWHVHSKYLYYLIPFCAAISRESVEALSGMDERFEGGIGFDDNDFVDRVTNMGLNTVLIDSPFCVHQKHPPTVYSNNINYNLYVRLKQQFPKRIKAEMNKIYVR